MRAHICSLYFPLANKGHHAYLITLTIRIFHLRILTHIPDPPVAFPFPREHPELSSLLNQDLYARERGEEKEKQKNKRVSFHYESAGVSFKLEPEQAM